MRKKETSHHLDCLCTAEWKEGLFVVWIMEILWFTSLTFMCASQSHERQRRLCRLSVGRLLHEKSTISQMARLQSTLSLPYSDLILLSTSTLNVADVMMTNCARFVIDKSRFTICILMTSPFASRSVTGTSIPCGFYQPNLHKQQIFHHPISRETNLSL